MPLLHRTKKRRDTTISYSAEGVDKLVLSEEVKFLHKLLEREFIWKEDPEEPEDFEATLSKMVSDGILKLTPDGKV